jgi:transposase-like protein
MCQTPTTLVDAVKFFSDLNRCNEYMLQIKWPDGKIVCPKCGSDRIGKIETRKMLRCKDCRKQFSYRVGTIFEDSPLGLDLWFVAVWCVTNCKNGISSHELARSLGITQKSAWHMLHRIRLAMQDDAPGMLKGTVEADESFVGGKSKNMHKAKRKATIKGRGFSGKTIVQGVLQRGGKVIAGVVKNTKRSTIQPHVRAVVEPGAKVYTDALASYAGLTRGRIPARDGRSREGIRQGRRSHEFYGEFLEFAEALHRRNVHRRHAVARNVGNAPM